GLLGKFLQKRLDEVRMEILGVFLALFSWYFSAIFVRQSTTCFAFGLECVLELRYGHTDPMNLF
ncbi:MAG: hypothetical protein C0433_02655, partial [Cyclobacterium sp.]|nr:hypothetical protein [Cyclobacterium sp.]